MATIIQTQGLPNGKHLDKVYEFKIEGNILHIPSMTMSRDELRAIDDEQEVWLEYQKQIKLEKEYYCAWRFPNEEELLKFIKLLNPFAINIE